eukprot:116345-Amphidinium_carterae.1
MASRASYWPVCVRDLPCSAFYSKVLLCVFARIHAFKLLHGRPFAKRKVLAEFVEQGSYVQRLLHDHLDHCSSPAECTKLGLCALIALISTSDQSCKRH